MASGPPQARATRRKPGGDPHRPAFHFQPPRYWMNDPNGLIQIGGRYHLFYQHNPHSAWWGHMCWGHADSADLVHWRDLPAALDPDRPYDEYGVWSGCAVDQDGLATIVYTGVWPRSAGRGRPRNQCQCIATSRDAVRWTKHPGNPVIAGPPPELKTANFRDPYVWRRGRTWHMVVGSAIRDRRGAALLYQSTDLLHWRYCGVLASAASAKAGRVWECPNFFQLGRKWVLLVSPIPLGRTIYFTGTFAGDRFTPEVTGEIDLGGCLYAPQVFRDAAGRSILFGWLWERRSRRAMARAGWAGVMSLPRVLTLRDDGRLGFAPAREIEAIRRRHWPAGPTVLPAGQPAALGGAAGDCLEIAAEIDPGTARRVVLKVLRSPRGAEETAVVFDRRAGTLAADTRRSSRSPAVVTDVRSAPLRLGRGERLDLRVFVDRSVVEIFANGHTCLTSRVYPTRPTSRQVALLAEGGIAAATRLDVWELRP